MRAAPRRGMECGSASAQREKKAARQDDLAAAPAARPLEPFLSAVDSSFLQWTLRVSYPVIVRTLVGCVRDTAVLPLR